MPAFTEMDPDFIRKALEGHTDVLSDAVKKEEAFFRNSTCPACGDRELTAFVNAANPFTVGALLPNKLLRCVKCETEFDPYSRFITKTTASLG